MVYQTSCNSCHRPSSMQDKRRAASQTSHHNNEQHTVMYHPNKETAAPRGTFTGNAHSPHATHLNMSMPLQEQFYPGSSRQSPYNQPSNHASMSCNHAQCSSEHKSCSPSYSHFQPTTWSHDPHGRHFELLPGGMAFVPQHSSAGPVNFIGVPEQEDCMQFDPYLGHEQTSCLGVLTPEQSPLVMSSTVREDRQYPSTPPPKAESPTSLPGTDEHNALLQKVLVSSTPVMRSDGLKKRNAKFDIPKHRTIETIDHLINEEKDDGVIKELKAQKRLLKNREAALQSRQRKKQRAEDLEKQVLNLTAQLETKDTSSTQQLPFAASGDIVQSPPVVEMDGSLLDRMASLRNEVMTFRNHNQRLMNENARISAEMRQALANKTEEVARLRRDNEHLLAQFQVKSDTPASTTFTSTDYSDVVEELDPMDFEHPFSYPEFSGNGEVAAAKQDDQATDAKSSHISPQLLVTLFLYGAHIASLADDPSSETTRIPVLSLDDRVASAKMLQTLFDNANKVHRSHRSVSDVWRKSIDPSEVAYAYPRIIADLKSMFEDPAIPSSVLALRK